MTAESNATLSPVMCWCGMGVQILLNADGSFGVKVVLANGLRLHTANRRPVAPNHADEEGKSYFMLVLPDAKAKQSPHKPLPRKQSPRTRLPQAQRAAGRAAPPSALPAVARRSGGARASAHARTRT